MNSNAIHSFFVELSFSHTKENYIVFEWFWPGHDSSNSFPHTSLWRFWSSKRFTPTLWGFFSGRKSKEKQDRMYIFYTTLLWHLHQLSVVALTDASVKVVLYKRCTFCPVFFALSTTEEASYSWGETFERSEASKAGMWETFGRKLHNIQENMKKLTGTFDTYVLFL